MNDYVYIDKNNFDEILKQFMSMIDDFDYDLIICISKGGFLIGEALSILMGCDFAEVISKRPGSNFNEHVSHLFNIVPKNVLKFVKLKERKFKYHDSNSKRTVYFETTLPDKKEFRKILLVDDCIDTGYTIIEVLNYVSEIFKNCEIKVAVLSYFDERKNSKPDYYLWKNTILSAPWTKDNKNYSKFLKHYSERKK